ncbi:hypothetical protein AAVH_33572 [Aphelenchoides avenae]|nr:hypothetical protein AAVH_33572 [Aphelenchus avenae]
MLVETSSSTDALELLTELKCAGLEASSDLTRGTEAESIVILSDDGSTPSEESSRNADDYALSNLPSDGLDPLALMDVLSKGLASGSRSGEGQAESSKAESSDRNPNTRVRHPIWELFVVTDACVRCKECGAELCLPPSTTVAKRHLRAKHPRLMQQVEKREVDWYPKQPAMKRLRRDVLQELAKEGASLVYPTSARLSSASTPPTTPPTSAPPALPPRTMPIPAAPPSCAQTQARILEAHAPRAQQRQSPTTSNCHHDYSPQKTTASTDESGRQVFSSTRLILSRQAVNSQRTSTTNDVDACSLDLSELITSKRKELNVLTNALHQSQSLASQVALLKAKLSGRDADLTKVRSELASALDQNRQLAIRNKELTRQQEADKVVIRTGQATIEQMQKRLRETEETLTKMQLAPKTSPGNGS